MSKPSDESAPTKDVSRHLSELIAVQNEIATAGLDLDHVMNLITLRSQVLTGATGSTVELADGEDELVYRAASGSAAAHVGLRLRMSASLVGLCHRTGQVMVCTDSELDPRVDREACRKVGLRSMVIVPLRRNNLPVGVLKVLSTKPNAFGQEAIQTLQLMAGLLGACMGNAAEMEARKLSQREVSSLNEELERRVADRTARLERALQVREEFLSAASHELKTPLSSLVLQAHRLRQVVQEMDPTSPAVAELNQLLPTVARQAHRISALVEDLLDAAHQTALTQRPREPVALLELMRTVATSVEYDRQACACTLKTEGDAGLHALADRVGLERAVRALLSNAFKFGEGRRVNVRVEAGPEQVFVRIANEGPGIPSIDQERIFSRFEKGTAEPGKWGMGLGLWIARRLIVDMGGTLTVESSRDTGATFAVGLRPGPSLASNGG